jgi:hypothetical protein
MAGADTKQLQGVGLIKNSSHAEKVLVAMPSRGEGPKASSG